MTKVKTAPGRVQRLQEELRALEVISHRDKAKVRKQDLEIARLQSQVKEEQAVNRRLVCALEQAEDEAKRLEQGLTPPGNRRSQDQKLAGLLQRWVAHWEEDYLVPGEHELVTKSKEALEDFYGVHPPREEP